jgi:Tol biopolymer transport system component
VVDSSNAVLKPFGNDWIAYQSSESGRPKIYVTRFPSPGAKYQASFAGGTQPVWSKDGKRLYYLDPAQKLTVVDLTAQKESISIGKPTTLFQTVIRTSVLTAGYDTTHDGRFLQLNSIMETSAPVTLVMNWDAELKK